MATDGRTGVFYGRTDTLRKATMGVSLVNLVSVLR